MRRVMFSCAVVIAVLVGVVGVGTASAGGSKTGQVCFKNQWQSLATASGATFASETACTSYVAKNATGALRASVDLRIETAPATCADVAVLYPPEPLDTTGVACAAQYVRLVNPGPFAVTVSGSFSGTCTATNLTAEDIECLLNFPTEDVTTTTWSNVSVPAGGTVVLAGVFANIVTASAVPATLHPEGTMSITSAATSGGITVADPNTTNNSVAFSVIATYSG